MRIGPVDPGRAQKLTGGGVTWLVRCHEWPPGDVAPVARGHERLSPNLTVVARGPAARAAGGASESPVGPDRPAWGRWARRVRVACE